MSRPARKIDNYGIGIPAPVNDAALQWLAVEKELEPDWLYLLTSVEKLVGVIPDL